MTQDERGEGSGACLSTCAAALRDYVTDFRVATRIVCVYSPDNPQFPLQGLLSVFGTLNLNFQLHTKIANPIPTLVKWYSKWIFLNCFRVKYLEVQKIDKIALNEIFDIMMQDEWGRGSLPLKLHCGTLCALSYAIPLTTRILCIRSPVSPPK